MLKKHDLKLGDIIQVKNGNLYVLTAVSPESLTREDKDCYLYFRRSHGYLRFTTYTEDLQELNNDHSPEQNDQFKVVKIYRPINKLCFATTCAEVAIYNLSRAIETAVDITNLGEDQTFIPLRSYV